MAFLVAVPSVERPGDGPADPIESRGLRRWRCRQRRASTGRRRDPSSDGRPTTGGPNDRRQERPNFRPSPSCGHLHVTGQENGKIDSAWASPLPRRDPYLAIPAGYILLFSEGRTIFGFDDRGAMTDPEGRSHSAGTFRSGCRAAARRAVRFAPAGELTSTRSVRT